MNYKELKQADLMEAPGAETTLYRSLDEAADNILNRISQLIPVNTFLIVVHDTVSNTVFKAVNKEEQLVLEGMSLPMTRLIADS